jgi:hypothetical protein
MLSDVGNVQAIELVYETLTENAVAVDILAPRVRDRIFFQKLYQEARTVSGGGQAPIKEEMQQIISSNPDFLKQPYNRIVFAYFALLAGEIDLPEKWLSLNEPGDDLSNEFTAYKTLLKSFIAARRNQFDQSIALNS